MSNAPATSSTELNIGVPFSFEVYPPRNPDLREALNKTILELADNAALRAEMRLAVQAASANMELNHGECYSLARELLGSFFAFYLPIQVSDHHNTLAQQSSSQQITS